MDAVAIDASTRGTDRCFVCEPGGGLKISFEHDAHEKTVTADLVVSEDQGGHQAGRIHPGVVLAVLEDAMSWALVAMGGTPGVPKRTTTEFLRPVKVGETYKVVGRLISRHDDGLDAAATVVREDGQPCAEARARYLPLEGAAGDTDSVDSVDSAAGTEG